jgi:hypothetical protein
VFTIRSSSSNRTLGIGRKRADYLEVQLSGFAVSAMPTVWMEAEDVGSLIDFFLVLGQQQQPWQGARSWGSLEGDFTLSATCSSLGIVVLKVALRGLQGAAEEWQVAAGIELEFGQLAQLADEARLLQH